MSCANDVQVQNDASLRANGQYRYPPTSEDWERIRPLLTRLYQDEKQTLASIISDVKTRHGFHAS